MPTSISATELRQVAGQFKTEKMNMPPKKSPKVSGQEEVDKFLDALDHPLKQGVVELREIILSASEEITEHIKWNAPSFCVHGEDRLTFNLHRPDMIMLVFHRGAKVRNSAGDSPLFQDSTGLLEWLSDDRAAVKLGSLEDVKAKRDVLRQLVSMWIAPDVTHPTFRDVK